MRIICSLFISLLVIGGVTPSELYGNPFSPAESRRILGMVDDLVSYEEYDFSAEYTIIDDKPGQGTSRTKTTVFRRDREDTYTIVVMEPESDKGKGYLRQGDMLWLYDPVPRRFTVTSARDRFQNSNARNSDFTKSTLAEDYRIVNHSIGKLGAYNTDVYELEALSDELSYPKMKIWIDQDNLVRKSEDYSLSGQHMRTTAVLDYTRIKDRYVPVRVVIQDELRGREVNGQFKNYRSLISVAKPSFQELPDMVFTRAYIERVSN